jgi:hypothetical protein
MQNEFILSDFEKKSEKMEPRVPAVEIADLPKELLEMILLRVINDVHLKLQLAGLRHEIILDKKNRKKGRKYQHVYRVFRPWCRFMRVSRDWYSLCNTHTFMIQMNMILDLLGYLEPYYLTFTVEDGWNFNDNPMYHYLIDKLAVNLEQVRGDSNEYQKVYQMYFSFHQLLFGKQHMSRDNYTKHPKNLGFPATNKIDRYDIDIFRLFNNIHHHFKNEHLQRLFKGLLIRRQYDKLKQLFDMGNGFFEKFIEWLSSCPKFFRSLTVDLNNYQFCVQFLTQYRPSPEIPWYKTTFIKSGHTKIINGQVKLPITDMIVLPLELFEHFVDKDWHRHSEYKEQVLTVFANSVSKPNAWDYFEKFEYLFTKGDITMLHIDLSLIPFLNKYSNKYVDTIMQYRIVHCQSVKQVLSDEEQQWVIRAILQKTYPMSSFFNRYFLYFDIHTANFIEVLRRSDLSKDTKATFQGQLLADQQVLFEKEKEKVTSEGKDSKNVLFCYNCGKLSHKYSHTNRDWVFCKCCSKTYCESYCLNYPDYLGRHIDYVSRSSARVNWLETDMNLIYPYCYESPIKVELNTCSSCGKLGKMLKCSRCQFTRYCNTTCQKNHWPHHKATCSSMSKYIEAGNKK